MGRTIFAFYLMLYIKNSTQLIYIIVFYAISVTLYALGWATEPDIMHQAAPIVLVMGFIFAFLLGLPRLFQEDHEDGVMDQWQLWPLNTELIVAAKLLAHWLGQVMPLVGSIALMGPMLGMEWGAVRWLVLAVGAASISLLAIGAVAEALTVGAKRQSAMLMVMVMPLYVPILLFVLATCVKSSSDAAMAWWMLSGLALMSAPLSVFISTWALKLRA